MNRFTKAITTIKKTITPNDKTTKEDISIIILSAGIGSRIKSNEPRSLIKIGNNSLIEHQLSIIKNHFNDPEIIGVFGVYIDRILKKISGKIRIIENQLYESTNSSESLRLAINNTLKNNVLFFHGDIYFNGDIFKGANFNKSFAILDKHNYLSDKEVGVTTVDGKISIFSYGLEKKWCQAAFLTGKELKILRNIYSKYKLEDKKMLLFEVLNKVIECGGNIYCHEPNNYSLTEIDCMKDLKNENFNI